MIGLPDASDVPYRAQERKKAPDAAGNGTATVWRGTAWIKRPRAHGYQSREDVVTSSLFCTLVHWLLTPISGAHAHAIAGWAAWHGRIMVLAWNVALPAGMLVARFGKVPRRDRWPASLDHPVWWRLHVCLQTAGVLLMSGAVFLAVRHAQGVGLRVRIHHLFGWSVAAAGWIQASAGALRGSKGGPANGATGDDRHKPGDHYDMTARRIAFERLHKSLGWLVLPLVWLATAYGLMLADAPRWMPAVLVVWWSCLLTLFVALQRRGLCIDTYQAIWGDDAGHPGNRRRPIGWGVVRASNGRLLPSSRE